MRVLIEPENTGTGGSEVCAERLQHLLERLFQFGFSDQGFQTGVQSRPAGEQLIEFRHVDGGFDDIGQVSERIEHRLGGDDVVAPRQPHFPVNRPSGLQGFLDGLHRAGRKRRSQQFTVLFRGQFRRGNAEKIADRGIGADQLPAIVVEPDRDMNIVKHQLPFMVGLPDRMPLTFRNQRRRYDAGAAAHDPLVDVIELPPDARIRDEQRAPQLFIDEYRHHDQRYGPVLVVPIQAGTELRLRDVGGFQNPVFVEGPNIPVPELIVFFEPGFPDGDRSGREPFVPETEQSLPVAAGEHDPVALHAFHQNPGHVFEHRIRVVVRRHGGQHFTVEFLAGEQLSQVGNIRRRAQQEAAPVRAGKRFLDRLQIMEIFPGILP